MQAPFRLAILNLAALDIDDLLGKPGGISRPLGTVRHALILP